MTATKTKTVSKRPRIHIGESDYDLIADLALRMERSNPTLAALVLQEIDRAQIHADDKVPANVVRLGSIVEFVDETNGSRRQVVLVTPAEADIEEGRVSIMTSVGAGLIGLAEGQAIDWPAPDGRARTLRISSVRPPEDD